MRTHAPVSSHIASILTNLQSKKTINIKKIHEFSKPNEIPHDIEDQILEVFGEYSMDQDLTYSQMNSFFRDLGVSTIFTKSNNKLSQTSLCIEGTDVIDFDKLLVACFHLIVFERNKKEIITNWNLIRKIIPNNDPNKYTINLKDLKAINQEIKMGISDSVLLDMVAVATEGLSPEVKFIDFAYIMGKLGDLV